MQKHVNLVDLVKSFPTNIYLQNLASIQPRTSPIKFAHLAEKSENGSIANLSTKVRGDRRSHAEDFREHLLGNGFHAVVVQENVRSGQQIRVRTDLSYDTGAETCETD